MSEREKLIEKMARGILDAELWPGAWEKANEAERGYVFYKATAALSTIEAEAVIVPREIDDETARDVWSAAYDEWAEFGARDHDAGRAGFIAMLAASPYRRAE